MKTIDQVKAEIERTIKEANQLNEANPVGNKRIVKRLGKRVTFLTKVQYYLLYRPDSIGTKTLAMYAGQGC